MNIATFDYRKGTKIYRVRHIDGHEYEDELREMQSVCLPRDVPLSPDDGGEWWVALYADAPIGFGAIKPSIRWPFTGYMSRAGVLPEHRGNGLQRRLIRARLAWAKRQGWQWVVTDNIEGNPESANNIANCGFKIYDPETKWGTAGSIYWKKYIAVPGTEIKCMAPH